MTNLIEKSLLLGFGIFTITIFTTILIPFLGSIVEYNYKEKDSLESYMIFMNEVDLGISYVSQHSKKGYIKEVDYPNNLNVSFHDHMAKYEFFLENKIWVRYIEYNITFFKSYFHSIPPQTYLLNISQHSTLIRVNISDIY